MNLTDLSFLGMMKAGTAQAELFTFLSTPSSHNWAISFLNCFPLLFGMEKALAWYGLTPCLSSIFSPLPDQVPKQPSNRS